jgi:diguanylate cyclase (GGDEF)-like protein/PAS domain S-box-containing protein
MTRSQQLDVPPGGYRALVVSRSVDPDLAALFRAPALRGVEFRVGASPADALEQLRHSRIDTVLLAIAAGSADESRKAIAAIRRIRRHVPIVILAPTVDAYMDLGTAGLETECYLPAQELAGDALYRALVHSVERAKTLMALRLSEERFKRLYEHSAVAIYELDLEGNLVSANPAMLELFGYTSESEILAANASHPHFFDLRDRDEWFSLLRREKKIEKYHKSMRTREGRRIELLDTTYLVHDAMGNAIGYQGTVVDFTEVHALSQQLSYEATHDSLTALPNRRAIEQQLQQAIEDSRIHGSMHALCYFDLDQFKVINDSFGHPAGDELLRQLGAALRERIADRDTLARVGGDEFAVLVRYRAIHEAAAIADDLLGAIRAFRMRWDDREIDVGASIGVVPIDANTASLSDLLGAADTACYTAKEKGRNRVHVQEPDDKTINRRISEMRLVVEAKHALQENRMRLFHQPIRALPLTAGDDSRFEILIRMLGWDGELVSPGLFLPAIEKYNLSKSVDCWVIDAFLGWMANTPDAVDALTYGSINISGLSLSDADFLKFICEQLDTRGTPGGKLCFEITETAAIQNLSAAQNFIATLRTRGCRFALDDFGSGLSSFGYLKNLPVDVLKIDGMFVRTLRHNRTDRVIVKSINEVAHSMGLLTIAEFVEDNETLQIVTDIGVDFAQGYAVGRPKPLEEFAAPAAGVARAASG